VQKAIYRMFLTAPPTNNILHPTIFGKDYSTFSKTDFQIVFSKIFPNILSIIHFMNPGFFILDIKKIKLEKIF